MNDIKNGDREAQRRFYERYAGYAMAVCQRYIPYADDARDVMHDSFVKILTSLHRFSYRGEGSLRAWITSIVVHQTISHLKPRERIIFTPQVPERMEEEAEPDVGRVPPDVLNRLIGRLPTGYRMVLNLYVFQQMTHKEIAQLLGISPETSASQYSRAKQALAKRIHEYLNNGKL